jgi:uncharacterized protein YbjT (DUF2867 family)
MQPVDVRDVAARLVELVAGPPAGRASDLGGPEVHAFRELARMYAHAAGLRRWVLALPVPGAAARTYREGRHLAPAHAAGRVTFGEYLRERGRPGR